MASCGGDIIPFFDESHTIGAWNSSEYMVLGTNIKGPELLNKYVLSKSLSWETSWLALELSPLELHTWRRMSTARTSGSGSATTTLTRVLKPLSPF
jgi:hypothetical protein